MNTATTCPTGDELRRLLGGSLSDQRRRECTDHLDGCAPCQARLEEVAIEGTRLSQVVRGLHQAAPMATSAYWPALRALDAESLPDESVPGELPPPHEPQTDLPQGSGRQGGLPPASTPRPASRRDEPVLDFLGPPSDPAYLGRLDQFDVMRIVGRGGMGVVLEAFDTRLRRNVAIKVLDPDLGADEIARQRFCREARAAASVTHDNVVAVHQVEKSGDHHVPYLVMQLVAGESLEQRLQREAPLPIREVVRIGMQAAHGLEAAHAQGLIHRDIKPGNILLETPHDRVKLTDFGLVRVADDVKLTQSGFVSGTPLYMAPEQAMGEEADHRSDLFSLGAVLYEMCAGQPPFTGNSALAILRQVAEVKHRPLRELNPVVPDWLSATIDRLLAKKPADRIPTAAQLAELFDYEWALMMASSEAVPVVCQVEMRRRAIRGRAIGAIVATAVLAVGLVGGKYLAKYAALPAAAVSSAEPLNVLSANAGAVWSVAFEPAGQSLAMAVEDGAVRIWDLSTANVTSTIDAHHGVAWSSKFWNKGDLLVTSGDDGLVKVWDLTRGEPLRVFEHTNGVRGLALARDGTLYTGSRIGILRTWSLDAESPLVEAQQPGAIYCVAISPDEETLATAGSDKIIRLWNAKTLTQKLRLEGHTGPVNNVSFADGGKRLVSVGWDRTIRIWDVGSGQIARSWVGHEGDIWGAAFSPDGSKLATGGFEGAVKLWDATSGELLATFLGHKVAIHTLAFNSDGTLLASGGRDGAVRIWKIE
jgi:hypothetical protein